MESLNSALESKGEFYCKVGILIAKFYTHDYSGQIRRRFHNCFWSLCDVVFPPATPPQEIFPADHYSRRTVSAALFTTKFCLPTMSATDVAGNIGRHLIWTQTASSPIVLLLLPAKGIVLPRCCDSYAVFCTFFSVANTLWNVVSVFIVLTCACQITGVILLSLFSFTLSPVASVAGEIFTVAAVASSSFGVRQRNLAGTLFRGKFGSFHVLFLCVHSILVFLTSQCPICGVECAYALCRGSRGESDLNGSPREGFTMCTICV